MITIDLQFLAPAPGSRILDIGCGTGRHVAAAHGLERISVVGADANLADLRQAAQRLRFHDQVGAQRHPPQADWALAGADILALPFADRVFDLVICCEVLEHIPDHHRAVREIVRVLKPDGTLAVSVPRRWPETICWALSRQYRRSPGGHIRIYQTRQLVRLIEAAGVVHRRTHYAHALHSPYWWLKCLVGLQRDQCAPVRLYHRLLTWDILQKPRLTRCLERWLNPLLGKSVVLYFQRR